MRALSGNACLRFFPEVSSKKTTQPEAQLKCLDTNAHSTKNKEELESEVQLENYSLTAITETWWDDSRNWNIMIKGSQLYRRNR